MQFLLHLKTWLSLLVPEEEATFSPFISNFRSIYQPLAADCLWSAALELETVRAAVGRSASRREAGI